MRTQEVPSRDRRENASEIRYSYHSDSIIKAVRLPIRISHVDFTLEINAVGDS
jgi:hypothetical protein